MTDNSRLHFVDNGDPRHRKVNVFIDGKLTGMLTFDADKYHEQWDSLVDLIIASPLPPGETQSDYVRMGMETEGPESGV